MTELLSQVTVIGVAQTLLLASLAMIIAGMFIFIYKSLPEKNDDWS